MAYYAWSNFRVDVDEHNKHKSVIEPGDTVTADKLKVSKDEFNSLVEAGAIREQPYPPVEEGQSPTEYYKALSAKAGSGELSSDEMSELMEHMVANPPHEPGGMVAAVPDEGVEEGKGPSGSK